MSLPLRQLCQSILDNIGLNNYHIRIRPRPDPHDMMIVGECGKPLVIIHGITFTKTNPSKKEMEYAIELLNAFLLKYAKELTDFTKIVKSVIADPKDKKERGYSFGSYVPNIDGAYIEEAITYADKQLRLVYCDNKLYVHDCGGLTLEGIKEFVPNKKLLEKMKVVYEKRKAYVIQEKAIEKFKDKLSNCEI